MCNTHDCEGTRSSHEAEAPGALKHLEKDNSPGWILLGSNGSGKGSSGLSFQQNGYCLILQIEEMKHRETTGWLIVEMKVKAVCFDFQSSPHKSSLPHPPKSCRKHPQGRAYTSNLLYVCGSQSSTVCRSLHAFQ